VEPRKTRFKPVRRRTDTDYLALSAIVSSAAMIAFQVGGRATRDALFLSIFPVNALPSILIASAAFSILAVLAVSRAMTARGPGGVIPLAFGISSILLFAEWLAFTIAPKAVAIALYLHMAAFGAILVSGFWSMIAELFDPRTAKARIGRITAGGTVGGLIGGVIAERTGALASVSSMLPILAVLHFLCAVLNHRLRTTAAEERQPALPTKSGFQVLREVPYVKQLAVLVLLGTIAETLLDYVLKTQASAAYSQGQELIRFFALFYTGVSLVTFFVQVTLSRYSLQRLGLTGTMATMPFMVAAGGLVTLVWPGLFSIGFVRGAQAILRSSLFRSGYELLYTPIPREEKRAVKTIVDVGFDRLGDGLGGGLISFVLVFGLAVSVNNRLLNSIAVVLGVISLVFTTRLSKGYVATLEKSLLNQAAELDLLDIDERTTRATMLRTLGTLDLSSLRLQKQVVERGAQTGVPGTESDPTVRLIAELRAEDAAVVRRALREQTFLDPLLVAPAIRLLARDDVSEDAVRALRKVAPAAVGQLTDALLNADEDFAVRRRIPRVLIHAASMRAVEGLMRGLADARFEVRFSCGRALSKLCTANAALRPEADGIYSATLKEITLAERLSEAPRVLDNYEEFSDVPSSDSLWNPTDIRLEHIFRLLSLSLPREPLHVSFQALHTDDEFLRGTALEYLESILPSGIREPLWQFLEGPSRPVAARRPADHILEDLMNSRRRIEVRLSDVRGMRAQRNV
jgi:AAA family ATP:ADP antiporter